MIRPPKTKEEALRCRYNTWAGNPKGNPYSPLCCAYEAVMPGRFTMFYQCSRKPVAGPDNLYCRQHAKMVTE